MKEDTAILPFRQSESVADPLTELAREGARRMLAEALKAEAYAFVASFAHEQLEDGRQRIVRHGFGPERQIQTGIGALDVQRPKVRDKMVPEGPAEKIRFTSHILPKWARRSVSLDALLPVLYLKGISTGDFQEALSAILGPDAPNLSPSVVSRLTAGWQAQYDAWTRRDLCARHYVYIWADGVVVEHEMHVMRLEDGTVDAAQKAQELFGPPLVVCKQTTAGQWVAGQAFADDHARLYVEGREQRGGPVALVIMGHRGRTTPLERQSGLGPVKRLNLDFSSRQSTTARSGGSR